MRRREGGGGAGVPAPAAPASSKSAAREPFVVSDPERARCAWLRRPSKRKKKPIPVSVVRSTKVGPARSAPSGTTGSPGGNGRSTRVTGPPTLSRRLGQHSRSRRTARPLFRKRPQAADPSSSGPLRDRRVRSQPGWHRPGFPQPATDPDSLYLRKGCGQGRRFSESAAESPGGAGWFSVIGRAGALGRSRW